MRRLVVAIASGGFVGYIPVVPATFGSLWGIPLFWCVSKLPPWAWALAVLATVGASCWVAERAEEYFGEKDSSKIVVDEIAGYLVTTLWLPFGAFHAAVAFVAFRFFDIVKIFPARSIDRSVPGGLGVVLDDVVSGVYANLFTRLFLLLWVRGGTG
ncbi:MAG: phosphatidylglycerophosphatase A [Candidatus Binatia bacterium]|nr:MAG: phosphatidylglycerophosphatase A [Candidatus Binatia bacterium]